MNGASCFVMFIGVENGIDQTILFYADALNLAKIYFEAIQNGKKLNRVF